MYSNNFLTCLACLEDIGRYTDIVYLLSNLRTSLNWNESRDE